MAWLEPTTLEGPHARLKPVSRDQAAEVTGYLDIKYLCLGGV
jgi:hypothetical protein